MTRIFCVLLCLFFSTHAFSQKADTLIKKLDSLNKKADSAGVQHNNTADTAYKSETNLTVKSYFILLASNLKQEFTKPFHMKHRDWVRFGTFGAAVGMLMLADEPIQKSALRLRNNSPGVVKVGEFISRFGGTYEFYTLAALGSYGFVFKDQKLKTTTLLATQAYITGAALESVLKFLSGRTRPNYYGPTAEAEPSFKGPTADVSKDFYGNRSNSAFPSGHATVAFAAATVFAMEYKKTVWVPIISYTAASLIGASRITENRHWTTDVLIGGMIGYLAGRQIVNNYHRYAKIRAPGQAKNSVGFDFKYNYNHIEPALVYHINK